MSDKEKPKREDIVPVVVKNATDLQRLKLEKLMKNPDKPVIIPDRPKEKGLLSTPDFVRNVMGSSAGAGSGEFHVYRHLRRKEYARQKFIQEKSEKIPSLPSGLHEQSIPAVNCDLEKLDEEYHMKIEQNRKAAEDRTAKKRAKRLKKKAKLKQNKHKKVDNKQIVSSQSEGSSEEDNTEDSKKESDAETIKGIHEQQEDIQIKDSKDKVTESLEDHPNTCNIVNDR